MTAIDIDQERESDESSVSHDKSHESDGKYEEYGEPKEEGYEAYKTKSSHLIISVTGWIFKPCLIGYVVRKSNEDSESVIDLGHFGQFPVFWDVKSFWIRNHFFS